ncbi:MAG TPA: DUF4388 domain-containing protein [Myxococcota bacterium]|nr:DUF4388 domain-containing protein [Myxococcota bacterium]HRY93344.1 DUF4388 domain-containing protein [Myxococcota bacterium]HSA21059.1 DUF4388 domain-containing protein [Myxococcota bacterium]
MPLSGTFDTLSLADLLQVVQQNQISGLLTVTCGLEDTHLVLARGDVLALGADDPARLDLGQELLAARLVSPGALQVLVRELPEGEGLREALGRQGGVDAEALAELEARHASELILGLLFREDGSFHLSTRALPEPREAGVPNLVVLARPLRTQGLLFDAMQRVDEWNQVRQVLPTGHVRVSAPPEALSCELPAVRRLAELGEALNVVELCLRMGGNRFELRRQLVEGHARGLVRVEPAAEGGAELEAAARLLEQARALLEQGRHDEAQAVLAVALGLDPDSERARELLTRTRADQLAHLRRKLESHRVPVLAVPPESLAGLRLGRRELYLASRLSGRTDVASLLVSIALGELETLRSLERLVDAGLVRLG